VLHWKTQSAKIVRAVGRKLIHGRLVLMSNSLVMCFNRVASAVNVESAASTDEEKEESALDDTLLHYAHPSACIAEMYTTSSNTRPRPYSSSSNSIPFHSAGSAFIEKLD
jgi:hypothetical protein